MRNRRSQLLLTGALLALLLAGPATAPAQPNEPSEEAARWSTAEDFRQAASRWVSVTFLTEGNRVRQVCGDLSRTHDVSIVLDRRLDPGRPVLLEPPVAGRLNDVVSRVAATQDAVVQPIGDALYVLPAEAAGPLATLIALRSDEVKSTDARKALQLTSSQLSRLFQNRPRQWDSFARPRDLLEQTALACGLSISNPEALRHDLWYAGALPRANAIEFLSFLLFQYDLTFAWQPGGQLQLRPIPNNVTITRTHRLTFTQVDAIKARLVAEFPDAVWEQRGSRIEVTGPAELHAALQAGDSGKNDSTPRVRWNDRKFTMRVQRKPLGEVLTYLQQAGLPVVFDAAELMQAGFDPEQLISFEVSNADAEGLFTALCDPLDLPWKIQPTGILIGPAKASTDETQD